MNIIFKQDPHNGYGEVFTVHCDQLPVKHECRIVEVPRVPGPGVWYFYTETRHAYSRRRGPTRKNREFKSLDAAKAAAVAYVKARVAEAAKQEPVRHGDGQYRKGESGGWWVAFDAAPEIGWHPAGSRKKGAIALLDNPPQWVKDRQRGQNIAENVCGRE